MKTTTVIRFFHCILSSKLWKNCHSINDSNLIEHSHVNLKENETLNVLKTGLRQSPFNFLRARNNYSWKLLYLFARNPDRFISIFTVGNFDLRIKIKLICRLKKIVIKHAWSRYSQYKFPALVILLLSPFFIFLTLFIKAFKVNIVNRACHFKTEE